MRPIITIPTKKQIIDIIRKHHLVKYSGKIINLYLIGSFCRGNQHNDSDVDILVHVPAANGFDDDSYTELNRKKLRDYFINNNIHGKCDKVHPQWFGRRLDIYFTFSERKEDCIKLN